MRRWSGLLLLTALAVAAAQWWQARDERVPAAASQDYRVEAPSGRGASDKGDAASRYPDFLPREALATIELIERGGPFPYERDGSHFQNRERRLPARPRGYYREYTVETPGARDRGARRIVSGGTPPEVYYYTDDHYRTFRRVEVSP
jgi:guanyl-specific ribonuclease Sa